MKSHDILSEYGPDSRQPQSTRATSGGVRPEDVKLIPQQTPRSPVQRLRNHPGLGGTVHPKGTQGKY